MVVAEHQFLVIDDDRAMAKLTASLLQRRGYQVVTAYSAAEAKGLLEANYFPIVISDLLLGDNDGISLMPHLKKHGRPSLMIFVTGYGSINTTVKAIHEGAFEYICKPMDVTEFENDLLPIVQRAIRQIDLLEKNSEDFHMPSTSERPIIGKSPQMVRVYRAIAKAALSRGNVVILGDSGTGKELVARAIHDNSPWRTQPFVTVNCGALTETLLESELFGHVKGSFTGATSNKRGLFEEANGGTIFLDEIGDITPMSQVKLLRAIQEGEIRPVGSVATRKVNVRVIAATHRDLKKLVDEGKFREDLYYRLKVFLIQVPPLRERIEDLRALVHHFLSRSVERNGYHITSISEDAMALLERYPWPGNIRELENAIERAAAMSNSNVLFPEDFPNELVTFHPENGEIEESPVISDEESVASTPRSLEQLERDHILRTLESVNYNKSKTAEILGIDRGTLYRKAIRYAIPLRHAMKEERTGSV
jgi:DNA-binding NtrC family response regulator